MKNSLFFALSAILLGFPAAAFTQTIEFGVWEINPQVATQGEAFNLHIATYDYSCADEYTHKNVVVDGFDIYLEYLKTTNPAVMCPAVVAAYGPDFEIPALKSGTYRIHTSVLAECMVQNPACLMAVMPVLIGTINITEKGGWYISQDQASAGSPFELQTLNSNHGSCHDSYEHLETIVQGREIFLSFLPRHNPDIVCITNIQPWGPVHSLPPLEAGNYQVSVMVRAACEFETDPCDIAITTEPAGVLHVLGGPVEKPTTWISPDKISAHTAGRIQVWSELFSCNSVLTQTDVTVEDEIITLAYQYSETRMACADVERAYAATFTLPELPPGQYHIFLDPQDGCTLETSVPCNEFLRDSSVGTLTVLEAGTPTLPLVKGPAGNLMAEFQGANLILRSLPKGEWRSGLIYDPRGKLVYRFELDPVRLRQGTVPLPFRGIRPGYTLVLQEHGNSTISGLISP